MDGTHEQLLSPCYCSGTIGLLHLTCLQKWLGTANKTVCELCNFQFTLRRKPKAFHKVCARQNLTKWKKWKTFNHEVKLVCKAPHDNVKNDSVENRHRQSLDGNTSRLSASSCPKSPPRKSLNIRSVEIKILTDSRSFLQSNTKGHMSSSEEHKRRHETIPHMSKLLGERNPCSASNGTGSERLHSDDQLSSSVGLTGGRRLKGCDDDEERDVHVSTWVMSSSEFREAYDRSRSPKSSQNESFHTALQSPRGALIPMGTRHTGPPGSARSVVNEIETKKPVNECRCLVNSPVQFTDTPAGQDNDRFRWTQMVAKETYI
ncbi:hypothetical protein FSP39_011058 [Pinctada imbricata]|uniref:RING-CH-type domain-containing protein n=1 Tax=Pinctada imbricata TaxID=66713 RepID=A0AA89C740_PINIB|nr:hypothetical protein FSP39_011058 [Pinctada imbricata]